MANAPKGSNNQEVKQDVFPLRPQAESVFKKSTSLGTVHKSAKRQVASEHVCARHVQVRNRLKSAGACRVGARCFLGLKFGRQLSFHPFLQVRQKLRRCHRMFRE